MKAAAVDLAGAASPQEVVRRALALRAAEALALGAALTSGDAHGLHDLRIAGKRLRYLLEIFELDAPQLASTLHALHDALGDLHDCDVALMAARDANAGGFAAWLAERRQARLHEARRVWHERGLAAALHQFTEATNPTDSVSSA